MRNLGLALVALLISVPAAASAGPDALSIAKRALRLAEAPPEVAQLYSEDAVATGDRHLRIVVLCPRGMVAMSALPHPGMTETKGVNVTRRRGVGVFWMPPDFPAIGPVGPSLTVTCIEGRLRR